MDRNISILIMVVLGAMILGVLFYKNRMQSDAPEPNWERWGNPNMEVPAPDTTPEPKQIESINSYASAMRAAKRENKKVFLYFSSPGCRWCDRMKSETFSDPASQRALSNYIVYNVNYQTEQDIIKRYKVRSFPTYFVVDGNEKIIGKDRGFKSAKSFARWLERSDRSRQYQYHDDNRNQPYHYQPYRQGCGPQGCPPRG